MIRRMLQRFAAQVSIGLQLGDSQLLQDTYMAAATLPSLTTDLHFKQGGYLLNGPLYEGSDLIVCFKGLSEYILKGLDRNEAKRIIVFRDATSADGGNQHIVPYELYNDVAKTKCFMVMPRLSSSLEPRPPLDEEHALLLLRHMTSALEYVHSNGFAHGDVKPSNICLRGSSEFVLIDFGSVSPFGDRLTSTPAYIPCDITSGFLQSAASVDWWMLAMTLAEKGCGNNGLSIGTSAVSASKAALIRHLETNLPEPVWVELRARLV